MDQCTDELPLTSVSARLIECAEALVPFPGSDPVAVMGGRNAQKLRSSTTGFLHASGDSERTRFKAVLDKYVPEPRGQGHTQSELS